MVKIVLIFGIIMSSGLLPTQAQRSPYAPRPVGVADVLPQYMAENTDNRFAGNDYYAATSTQAPPQTQTAAGTLENVDIVNRVSEWPKERQPFWYLNQQHIQNQREQSIPCRGPNCVNVQQQVPSRSPFLGSRSNFF